MICRTHVFLFSVYLATSPVSVAITPLSVLMLLFLDNQGLHQTNKQCSFYLDLLRRFLLGYEVDSSASFGYSQFRNVFDSAKYNAWSSHNLYQCYVESTSLWESRPQLDDCSRFHPLHVGPLVNRPGCESNQSNFSRYHSLSGC